MNKKVLSLGFVTCFAVLCTTSCSGHEFKITVPEVNVLSYNDIKDKDITVKFWHGFGQDKSAVIEEIIEQFNKVYPHITIEAETQNSYDSLKEAMSLSIPDSAYPDVVIGYPDHFAEYIANSIVVPLDEYMNSEDPEVGIGAGAKNAKNDFFDNYMTENKSFIDDLTFGLPFNKSTEVAVYNKTLFDQLGLEAPKTWDELETVGKALREGVEKYVKADPKKGENTKLVCGEGENAKELDFSAVEDSKLFPISYDSTANAFITMTKAYGGAYTEKADLETGYLAFDNDQAKEALTYLKGMADDKLFATPDTWEDIFCSSHFTALQSFYNIGSTAGVEHCVPESGLFEPAVAPIPYHTNGNKDVIQQGTNIAMLANDSDEVRLASWLFIRFLTAYHCEDENSPVGVYDANVHFALKASYLPVRKSGVESDAYQEFINKPLDGLKAKEKIKIQAAKVAAEAYDDTWTKFVDPAFVGSSTIRLEAGQIIPAATLGGKDAATAIADAYKSLNSYVKKD